MFRTNRHFVRITVDEFDNGTQVKSRVTAKLYECTLSEAIVRVQDMVAKWEKEEKEKRNKKRLDGQI